MNNSLKVRYDSCEAQSTYPAFAWAELSSTALAVVLWLCSSFVCFAPHQEKISDEKSDRKLNRLKQRESIHTIIRDVQAEPKSNQISSSQQNQISKGRGTKLDDDEILVYRPQNKQAANSHRKNLGRHKHLDRKKIIFYHVYNFIDL